MKPLLAIDIGNSTVGIAFYEDGSSSDMTSMATVPTDSLKTHEGLKDFINSLEGLQTHKIATDLFVIVASVVPSLNALVSEALKKLRLSTPLFVSATNSKILSFDEVNYETIGADRIACGVAAYSIYGGPVAVIDLGSATTISVIDQKGAFIGGAIMPGLSMMLDCLNTKTDQLPKVRLTKLHNTLGQDTTSAILSGVVIGTAGAIEKILVDIEKERGFRLKLVLTGGHSDFMKSYISRPHEHLPFLIYEGMRIIHRRHTDE